MEKVLDFFKKIPAAYYRWKQRNEKLDNFLESCKDNKQQLIHIDQTVTNMQEDLEDVHNQISNLEQQVDRVNGRLESIGAGTKMELFDTLHRWRITLVVEKQWASPAEKREVHEIYTIYHDKLKGNGQGERYYNEIMRLPESKEELLKRKEGLL